MVQTINPPDSVSKLKEYVKKEARPTQIDLAKVTQMSNHANKSSIVVANVNQNYGFDKCKSFEEIAHLALHRAFNINSDGLCRVNISVNNRKELSVFFYSTKNRFLHFFEDRRDGCSLEELDQVFTSYERKEVSYANA